LRAGVEREQVIREAIASGHGIGKSALVAWLILWAMSTKVDTKGVVTANTERQLKTKTWAELGKWHRLSICSHLFEFTATALFCSDKEFEKTWRVDQVVWSERNTEAFAGLHNKGNRILLVFDEASGIPDTIWEVSEGALTDEETEIIWVAFGNPTRNTGRFKTIFGRLRHRWKTRHIDSRQVPGTNKKQIQEWVDDYGEDSDFVRVRVKGVFPRAGSNQFIAGDVVEGAQKRKLPHVDLGHKHFDPI
ncbi:MAG: terminase, partial [Planctomycetes bacterium]|nr:terminase [Planctomycetota bacterium]